MPPEERRKVDELLAKRDQKEKFGSRVPAAIFEELDNPDDELENTRRRIKRQMAFTKEMEEDDEFQDAENYINRENVKGKEVEWIQQPHGIRYIRNVFSKFIKTYKDEDGQNIYENRINDMTTNNRQSLEVSFPHLYSTNHFLGEWVLLYPDIVIPYLDDIAFELTIEIYPSYSNIFKEIFVRIREPPQILNIRELKCDNIGHLITIAGVVTKEHLSSPS